jgi:hypothetical protein
MHPSYSWDVQRSTHGADASGWGVHVCTGSHYDPARLVCRQSDIALSTSAFANAQLSITGRSGAKFTSGTLKLTLVTRTHTGDIPLGNLILSVGSGDNARSLALVDAFIAFGVEPSASRTYVVKATEWDGADTIQMGSAIFTLRRSGIAPALVPPSGNPRVVVTKRHGAALRANPSSDAPIQVIVPCGTQLTLVGQTQGWYRVFKTKPAAFGWVSGLRMTPLGSAPAFICAGAVTYQVGDRVRTHVPTGCLSLRSSPSRQASYAHCVANGHIYAITNGPIEVAGEDWFGVFSASTGAAGPWLAISIGRSLGFGTDRAIAQATFPVAAEQCV